MSERTKKQRIVILGGGFGGAYCAQQFEKQASAGNFEVILIDKRNYFIFYPLLVEAGTGSLEPRHAVVSHRTFCRKTRLIVAEATGVDEAAQEVSVRLTGTDRKKRIRYDHLVIALGSVTNLPPIEGLREYAFGLKTIADSVALRDRAIQLLEIANQIEDETARRAVLRCVIVGGSYTGVEAAGELHAFMRRASKSYENIHVRDIEFVLVERSGRILSTLDEGLAAKALKNLRSRGVKVVFETTLKKIEADSCDLSDGTRIDTKTVVWCAGISPNPLLAKLPIPTDERGYMLCERNLRVKGKTNIWGIGDCAVNPDKNGKPYPATAQLALKQGRHLAKNLMKVFEGEDAAPCDITSEGVLAAYGCYQAVARVGPFRISGFPAWFLWRSVYLFKMPTLARKIRVALDWTMDLFLPQEVVQLGVHRIDRGVLEEKKAGNLESDIRES